MAESVPVPYQLRVKQRTKVVEFGAQDGIKPTSRYFGLDRRTIRAWSLEAAGHMRIGAALSDTAKTAYQFRGVRIDSHRAFRA